MQRSGGRGSHLWRGWGRRYYGTSARASALFLDSYALSIRIGSITNESSEAIVNAANGSLRHGGGVAAAISSAGGPSIQHESDEWRTTHGIVPDGQVAVTGAGNLLRPIRFVIHAVGPIWRGGTQNEDETLSNAVLNSLRKAEELKLKSIAIPAISSGIFGFPKERCANLMLATTCQFCKTERPQHLKDIRFTNNDEPTVRIFLEEFRKLPGITLQ